MNLIGKEAGLDSMKLVELCLALEDKAGDLGFEFDWTSEAAMSRSRSLFRTVTSLAEEFLAQAEKEKMIIVTGASRGLGGQWPND